LRRPNVCTTFPEADQTTAFPFQQREPFHRSRNWLDLKHNVGIVDEIFFGQVGLELHSGQDNLQACSPSLLSSETGEMLSRKCSPNRNMCARLTDAQNRTKSSVETRVHLRAERVLKDSVDHPGVIERDEGPALRQ
jgi:hypothetical protein